MTMKETFTVKKDGIEWTRVDNDNFGNPRYTCHFLNLIHPDNPSIDILGLYDEAVKAAHKIGGKKYRARWYGGGIVFTSYNLESTENRINKLVYEGI